MSNRIIDLINSRLIHIDLNCEEWCVCHMYSMHESIINSFSKSFENDDTYTGWIFRCLEDGYIWDYCIDDVKQFVSKLENNATTIGNKKRIDVLKGIIDKIYNEVNNGNKAKKELEEVKKIGGIDNGR